jgi:hypothetical protein
LPFDLWIWHIGSTVVHVLFAVVVARIKLQEINKFPSCLWKEYAGGLMHHMATVQ